MVQVDLDVVRTTVFPVGFSNGEIRLSAALVEVWRDVDFDSHFLGVNLRSVRVVGLRITARDQNSAVVEKLKVYVGECLKHD